MLDYMKISQHCLEKSFKPGKFARSFFTSVKQYTWYFNALKLIYEGFGDLLHELDISLSVKQRRGHMTLFHHQHSAG